MADTTPQDFAHHARLDPLFHFFLLPVVFITTIGMAVMAVRRPGLHSAWALVVSIALVVAVFKIRLYALKVQDRVIRLEERLRLASVLKDPLRGRIGELTISQLIALRFASDAELPALVQEALDQNLSRTDIKKRIKDWRADEFRV